MGKFNIEMKPEGEKLKVTMKGSIDEDVDFAQHPLASAAVIELEMSGIEGINSCGIREWIKWMSTVSNSKIIYIKCPKVIVDQINIVDGFLPNNGQVESFFVPYYSEDTAEEKNILFRFGQEFTESSVTPPKDIKDQEGGDMEMDVIEAKYFKFLKKK
ncbi:MAG: hypothetical protein ACOYOK_03685 [Pseudobdellovibrionaceae bacterium]